MEPEETAVARQRLSKRLSPATTTLIAKSLLVLGSTVILGSEIQGTMT
jgi:hypothetical protein